MGESWGMNPTLHTPHAPVIIATLRERAPYRVFEFFTANIRNPNTRCAYVRVPVKFFGLARAA